MLMNKKILVIGILFFVFLNIANSYANNLDEDLIKSNNYNSLTTQNNENCEKNENNYIKNHDNFQPEEKRDLSTSQNSNSMNISINSLSKSENINLTTLSAAGEPKLTTLSQSSILTASNSVKNYISKNAKLPNYVIISGFKFSMPEFTYLMSKTIQYKYKKINSPITIKYNIKNPVQPSGTNIEGVISSKNYYQYATNIANFIKNNNIAPNFVKTSLGKMQYQSAVYGFAKILSWSKTHNNKLPTTLTHSVKKSSSINKYFPNYASSESSKTVPSDSSKTFKMTEILDASKRVQNYIETNKVLPKTVTITNSYYNMEEFIYLMSKCIINKNNGKSSDIKYKNVQNPTMPSGDNIKGNIYKKEYISLSNSIVSFIDQNNIAPNYVTTSLGKMQYHTTIYGLAKILNYVNINSKLPNYVSLNVLNTNSINENSNSNKENPTDKSDTTQSNSFNEKYNGESLSIYLKATDSCEVNDPQIKSLAASITAGCKTQLEKATKIFNWVKQNLAYDFYWGTQKGAKKTMTTKRGNCVDHSHLLIALSRASGIPARYKNGDAYFISSAKRIGHTWAQVLVGNQWLVADAISLSNSLGIIKNWNSPHITGTYYEINF